MRYFTRSPIETNPTIAPSSITGRWRMRRRVISASASSTVVAGSTVIGGAVITSRDLRVEHSGARARRGSRARRVRRRCRRLAPSSHHRQRADALFGQQRDGFAHAVVGRRRSRSRGSRPAIRRAMVMAALPFRRAGIVPHIAQRQMPPGRPLPAAWPGRRHLGRAMVPHSPLDDPRIARTLPGRAIAG